MASPQILHALPSLPQEVLRLDTVPELSVEPVLLGEMPTSQLGSRSSHRVPGFIGSLQSPQRRRGENSNLDDDEDNETCDHCDR